MDEITSETDASPKRPGGLLLFIYRLPVHLYHWRLGWLLRHRFLMLSHKGRKSGRIYQTVVEVIHYNPSTKESIVVSMLGQNSDWYQNIRMCAAMEIRTGRLRYIPNQRFLTKEETYATFIDFENRHQWAARRLIGFLGYHYDGSEQRKRALVSDISMVSFSPK